MTATTCKSCFAPIVWCVTPNGKRIPMDVMPSPRGNMLISDGVAVVVGPREEPHGRERYTSHFATCPNASKHRSAKGDPR